MIYGMGPSIRSAVFIRVHPWLLYCIITAKGRNLLPVIISLVVCCNAALEAETNAAANSKAPAASAIRQPAAGFRVKPGFRVELVASAPMVSAPVALAFDEDGRLFVLERRDNSAAGETNSHPGRVRLLESADTTGVYQTSTIYADGLPWASAIACYSGGLFVAAIPDLFYLKDSKHDGAADVKQVVFTGFGGTNTPNPQLLPNNFNWGLDCQIHGATGGIGGLIVAVDGGAGPGSIP